MQHLEDLEAQELCIYVSASMFELKTHFIGAH